MTTLNRPTRRSFLVSAAAVGGGLVLGFETPAGTAHESIGVCEINAWIVIAPDDTVVVRVARAEMGQGISTALPMLVAEELECDFDKVRPEFVSPQQNLAQNRRWGDMSTSASRSVAASQAYLRRAGATAREMLIAAAAVRWNVAVSECSARNSIITHRPSGRTLRFGEVAEAAATISPPEHITLKDPAKWTLLGTPRKHFEAHAKVTGQPIYGIDVRLPDMLHAAIVQCPIFKGTLASVDDAKATAMPGVRGVVKLPYAVAVVADSWWRAHRAADALQLTWNDAGNGNVSSATIHAMFERALAAPSGGIGRKTGDVPAALANAAIRIESVYATPFLAHATMEPQNCTAHVTADRVEVWVPTQDAETALATAADASGLPRDKIVVHRTMLGGGFGRRGPIQEYVQQAVLIAKTVKRPVKLVWTRDEDIQRGFFRPASLARLTGGLDTAGMPMALSIRIAGQSIVASLAPEMMMRGMVDHGMFQGILEDMAYDVPNVLVDAVPCSTPLPVGPWRSVNHAQNAFYKESFVDEMAHAAGQDPYLFRRKLLRHKPRHLATLDAAARKANWGSPLPPDVFRGIALHETTGSICAQVVEVSVGKGRSPRVIRVVSAIDAGHIVNPLTIELQTQGAIAFALTAALYGEITVKDGQVEQSNFHDYEMLRMAEMPVVETIIMPSAGLPDDAWGGVGEPPLPPLAPALCNAIFTATGKRIRTLPIKNHDLS
jgi:isoquinoline 1-oxidoreductase beta subunit